MKRTLRFAVVACIRGSYLHLNPGFKTDYRTTGIPWEYVQDGANSFYSTSLLYAEKTDLVFTETLPPPPGLVTSVCVSFKYRKYSLGN